MQAFYLDYVAYPSSKLSLRAFTVIGQSLRISYSAVIGL
jgi:hypothetical protein